jgi:hypothetical protein
MSCAGADAGQIFNNRAWSTTVIGLRRYDLHPDSRAKKFAWIPIIVLEGPTEPLSLQFILRPLIDFFKKHDPGEPLASCMKHAASLESHVSHQIGESCWCRITHE